MKKKSRSKQGKLLCILVIFIALGNEAFAYFLNSNYQPESLAEQYFRIVLTVPVLIFFYLGYMWAVWLMRIGMALGIIASIFLTSVLSGITEENSIVLLSYIPAVGNIIGTWILFGSESFKSYIRHMKRNRGAYD